MDRAPLPIPDGLVQIWIQYEYRKRNPMKFARKSICEAVFSPDDETARLVSAAWQPAPDPDPELAPDSDSDPEPEAKRVKPNPERDESENDNQNIIITPDNNFTDLKGISDFERGEKPERIELPPEVIIPDDEREKFRREFHAGRVNPRQTWDFDSTRSRVTDHDSRDLRSRHSIAEEPAITALYKKFAQDEIKFFEKKRGSLEDADIIQLLACRRNCERAEKMLLHKIKLPIRKMKIVTDYWKTKVEIYRDPESEKHLNFQFWRHEEGCLLWTEGENVRLIIKETYQEVAAEYVVAMMKHPKMRFKELIFDIEPWNKGPAEFPDLKFYTKLEGKLKRALLKKKVKVRHLFVRSCSSIFLKDQWSLVVPYFRRKWLKLITLRIWDDKHVGEREKRKRKAYSDGAHLMEDRGDQMPKAWKSATHLDYRDENLFKSPINWYALTTFHSIQMLEVHWEAFNGIINAFKKFPPHQRCTISVEKELNLKNIKWYFKKRNLDLSQVFASFKSCTRRSSITIKLQDRKIIIDTERAPGEQLDDRDPAHASSDESWTE